MMIRKISSIKENNIPKYILNIEHINKQNTQIQ